MYKCFQFIAEVLLDIKLVYGQTLQAIWLWMVVERFHYAQLLHGGNSPHNFNEMPVRWVLRMKIIISLIGVI